MPRPQTELWNEFAELIGHVDEMIGFMENVAELTSSVTNYEEGKVSLM